MKATLIRYYSNDFQTLGQLSIFDNHKHIYSCYTLELPWKNNERMISRIPNGTYNVVKRSSDKFKDHFHILDVENRDYILIHVGNFNHQIKGCVLVGKMQSDINSDGQIDVTYSRDCMDILNLLLPSEFELKIIES